MAPDAAMVVLLRLLLPAPLLQLLVGVAQVFFALVFAPLRIRSAAMLGVAPADRPAAARRRPLRATKGRTQAAAHVDKRRARLLAARRRLLLPVLLLLLSAAILVAFAAADSVFAAAAAAAAPAAAAAAALVWQRLELAPVQPTGVAQHLRLRRPATPLRGEPRTAVLAALEGHRH
jgi:hypothetical protein